MHASSPLTVLQLGATTDQSSVYADAAHRLGYGICLVDSAHNIKVAQANSDFDCVIALDQPWSLQTLRSRINESGLSIHAIIPGIDASVPTAHLLSIALGCAARHFATEEVPNKAMQRMILRSNHTGFEQPRFLATDNAAAVTNALNSGMLSTPLIIKPVRGNGGLGVCLISRPHSAKPVIDGIQALRNRSGDELIELIAEEYIEGTPCSVQGTVADGIPSVYSFTYQLTTRTASAISAADHSFDEQGHIVRSVDKDDGALLQATASALSAFGMLNGAFYIDMIARGGRHYFIEAGFRLSADGVASLTNAAAGVDWGFDVVSALITNRLTTRSTPQMPAGRGIGEVSIRNSKQWRAFLGKRGEFEEFALRHPSDTSKSSPRLQFSGPTQAILQAANACLGF